MAPRKRTDEKKEIDFLLLCIKETEEFKPNWENVADTFNMSPEEAEKQLANYRKGLRIKSIEEYVRLDVEQGDDGDIPTAPVKKAKAEPKPKKTKKAIAHAVENETDAEPAVKDDKPKKKPATRAPRKAKEKAQSIMGKQIAEEDETSQDDDSADMVKDSVAKAEDTEDEDSGNADVADAAACA